MQIEIRCVFRNATLPKMIWDGVRSEIDPTITSISSILIITVSMVMIALGIMEYKAENVKTVKEVLQTLYNIIEILVTNFIIFIDIFRKLGI